MEFVEESEFVAFYKRAKAAIRDIVDMPDRDIDRLIQYCIQNNGRLPSARRHEGNLGKLTDEEVTRMEEAILEARSNRSKKSTL